MSTEQPWYRGLPVPEATSIAMSVHELHHLSTSGKLGETYIVIDVRRTDIDVRTGVPRSKLAGLVLIRKSQEGEGRYLLPSAINLPAQTFYQTLPALFHVLCK